QLAGIGNGNGKSPVVRLFEWNEVVAEHQTRWDLGKQVVVQLEVMQVHILTPIPSRHVLGAINFRSVGGRCRLTVSSAHEDRFLFCFFRHAFHSTLPWPSTQTKADITSIPMRKAGR